MDSDWACLSVRRSQVEFEISLEQAGMELQFSSAQKPRWLRRSTGIYQYSSSYFSDALTLHNN